MGSIRSSSATFLSRGILLTQQFNIGSKLVRAFCDRNYSEKCLNQVTLLGRVGSLPQIKGTEDKPMAVFSMATNRVYKMNESFERNTEWHKIAVFKQSLVEMIAEYLKKGDRVLVQGKLAYTEFTDSNGVKQKSSSVIAEEVIFASKVREDID